MADKNPPPKRWIIAKLWEHAVQRTEAEIEELKAHRLFVRDATAQDKTADGAPVPAAPPATTATTPAGTLPPGAKTDTKE